MAKKRTGLTFYQKEKKINKKVLGQIGSFVFITFVTALVAFVFIFCFGIKTSVIGLSMEPTLYSGEEILIDRFAYFLTAPKSQDVVVFLPNGNTNSHYYVKRVVGVPGDTVIISNGLIYVNGEIFEDIYFYDKIEDGGIAEAGVTLGEDEFFVLGDNRNNSEDSRSSNIGIVRKDYISGKAWFHFGKDGDQPGFIK